MSDEAWNYLRSILPADPAGHTARGDVVYRATIPTPEKPRSQRPRVYLILTGFGTNLREWTTREGQPIVWQTEAEAALFLTGPNRPEHASGLRERPHERGDAWFLATVQDYAGRRGLEAEIERIEYEDKDKFWQQNIVEKKVSAG